MIVNILLATGLRDLFLEEKEITAMVVPQNDQHTLFKAFALFGS